MRKAAVLGLLVLMFVACSRPTDRWHTLPTSGWLYGDTLVFEPDTVQIPTQNLRFTVKHDDAYTYANVWVEVSYDAEGMDTAAVDTFDVRLADVYGRWYGNGSGLTFQHTDTLHLRHMPRRRTPLRVRHIMRLDTLGYIEQIGVDYVP